MITVLTPTYNRKELLPILFESLVNQDDQNFEWLIIDDGSTDNTEKILSGFMSRAVFPIRYKKKENGGKHKALNYAYQFISNPLTFIVDSDDRLTEDAISTIKYISRKYESDTDLCGFSFLRGKPDGGLLSDCGVPLDGMKETYVECRINRSIGGDMAEVWYTKCLKEYPFPEFDNEKFLGEDIVWIRMAEKYQMRFFNKVIYISNYLEDGLTNNRRKLNITSPNGCVARSEAFLESKANAKAKIKAMMQYLIYGRFALIKTADLYQKTKNKMLFACLFAPSYILYTKWEYNLLAHNKKMSR